MPLKAIFLGSLGTIGETCELQRRALNTAFGEAGLDWDWTSDQCREFSGRGCCSAESIANYAKRRDIGIDAEQVHRRKTEVFRDLLAQVRVTPRPGLGRLIDAVQSAGLDLALVTTAAPEDVDTMLAAAGLSRGTFTFVGDASRVERPKPAPDIYFAALDALSLRPEEAISVEDTPENTESACAAGVQCVAFPGAAHISRGFASASRKVRRLEPRDFDLQEQRIARRA